MPVPANRRLLLYLCLIILHLRQQLQGANVKGFGSDETSNKDAASIQNGDSFSLIQVDLNNEIHDESRIEVHGGKVPIKKKDYSKRVFRLDTDMMLFIFMGIIACLGTCMGCAFLCVSEGRATKRFMECVFFPLTFVLLMCMGEQQEPADDSVKMPVKVGSRGGPVGWFKGLFGRPGGQGESELQPMQCNAPCQPRQAPEMGSIHVAPVINPNIVTTISPDCRIYPSITVASGGQSVPATEDPWEFANESEQSE